MISLKDYAKKHNITYEAVRKQVVRYKDELGEHLYKEDRTQFLDEEGEAFLDQKRAANPIIVMEADKDERMEALQNENDILKMKVMQLQEQIISRDEKVMGLQEKLLLLSENTAPEPDQQVVQQLETEKARAKELEDAISERDKKIEQGNTAMLLLESEKKTLEERAAAAEEREKQLKEQIEKMNNRGFFARLFNR